MQGDKLIPSPTYPILATRLTVVAVVSLGVFGCSEGQKDDEPAVSASEVCDGTLDNYAIAALERISGTDKFKESTLVNEAGEPGKFSLDRAVKNLHATYERRTSCVIHKANDRSGHRLMDIEFEPSSRFPEISDIQKSGAGKYLFYKIGKHAKTHDQISASLYFNCRTEGKNGATRYVDATMFSNRDQVQGNSTSQDRMTILNSVSRSLAVKLGCAAEAKLPYRIPSPEAP